MYNIKMLTHIKQNKGIILWSMFVLGVFAFIQFRLDQYLQYSIDGQSLALRLQELLTLFLSIIAEAFPFVILGTIISVIVALFIKSEWILKYLPKNVILSNLIISLFGVFMPVCECGNVPVTRRLLSKNFTVSQSIVFLLAAPIINPITLWSTIEAFSPDTSIVIIRLIGALVIANLAGFIISFKKNQYELLQDDFYNNYCKVNLDNHDHNHDQHSHHDHLHHHHNSKIEEAFEIFRTEFWEVTKLLCLGAFFAALSQIFIPRDVITSIGQSPILSIVAMMLFAFVISICSNVDAFVALPYVSTFSLGSIMSFLLFGPMIDMKILTMLKSSFKLKLIIFLVVFVGLSSFLAGLIINLLV